MTEITPLETGRLEYLEGVIENALLRTPLSANEARRITDEVKADAAALWTKLLRLYGGEAHIALGHTSWGAYFEQEFGQKKSRGYQLLESGRVLRALSDSTNGGISIADVPIGEVHHCVVVRDSPNVGTEGITRIGPIGPIPTSERVARELTPLLKEPDALREAWGEAVVKHGPEPTALQVREIVSERTHNHRGQGTGENEWYTPAKYIEMARTVLGAIDLDPASSKAAQATVRATEFFIPDDDGLRWEWRGRVWLNPPYSQPYIEHFVRKLVDEVMAGRTTDAILLTHNYTDTVWFHHAAAHCVAVCLTRGRIRFLSPQGIEASPTQGQAFFYFGSQVELFEKSFESIGVVLRTRASV